MRTNRLANKVQAEWAGLDDFGDAMRHAEWNRQMAVEIGSVRAWVYGTGHEITGWFDQGDLDAMRMDLQARD